MSDQMFNEFVVKSLETTKYSPLFMRWQSQESLFEVREMDHKLRILDFECSLFYKILNFFFLLLT